jgi:hypothetical protein
MIGKLNTALETVFATDICNLTVFAHVGTHEGISRRWMRFVWSVELVTLPSWRTHLR